MEVERRRLCQELVRAPTWRGAAWACGVALGVSVRQVALAGEALLDRGIVVGADEEARRNLEERGRGEDVGCARLEALGQGLERVEAHALHARGHVREERAAVAAVSARRISNMQYIDSEKLLSLPLNFVGGDTAVGMNFG